MTVVRTTKGLIRGSESCGVHAFLGVPYADSPLGENRMRPPRSAREWAGVRDATQYGATVPKGDYPPQYATLFPEVSIAGPESLNLNVWTPDPSPDAGLAVLVWIHGGSFTNGSGSVVQYRGDSFAQDGIVTVTINYRLGAEGFLQIPGGTANIGLLDQIAALEWVRDNIASFGGDPSRVTVAGQSAGGGSVLTLLSMDRAKGLFSRAIAQSPTGHQALQPSVSQKVVGHLADRLGVSPSMKALEGKPIDEITEVASALVSEVQSAPDPEKWGEIALSLMPFQPVLDGEILRVQPLDAIKCGVGDDIPLMIGYTAEEARLFFVPSGVIDMIDDSALAQAAAAYGIAPARAIEIYRGNRPNSAAGDILAAIVTDWFFRIPAVRIAEARAPRNLQTYMYEFGWGSEVLDGRLGSCHASEVPFVFKTAGDSNLKSLMGDAPPQALEDAVHGAWTRFVETGDPGWASFETTSRATMTFDSSSSVVFDPRADERDLWAGCR